jgi:5'-nucleotidase
MDNIKAGHDGKRKYYWIVRGKPDWKEVEGTDISALGKNRISITPLHSDMSSETHLESLGKAFPPLFQGLRGSNQVKG